MAPAARLHDPIDHSHAMSGLIAGALIGGAAALVVLTAPISLPVILGGTAIAGTAVVAGGAVLGAGLGEMLGSLSPAMSRAGEIVQPGALNVWINSRRAARAHVDTVVCDHHAGRPVIAQGSTSVFINGRHAARKGDHTACGAVIADGSPNVVIGGGTTTTDHISPEVPSWVHWTMLGVGVASAAILAGPAAAALGLIGSVIGGGAMHAVGGAIFGEGSDGQKVLTFAGTIMGGGLAGRGGRAIEDSFRPTTESEGGGEPDPAPADAPEPSEPKADPPEPVPPREPAKVTATAKVNGKTFTDTNQGARDPALADPNKPTLIADRIAAKQAKSTRPLPNGNMADAHAEIGAIQQAYEAVETRPGDDHGRLRKRPVRLL